MSEVMALQVASGPNDGYVYHAGPLLNNTLAFLPVGWDGGNAMDAWAEFEDTNAIIGAAIVSAMLSVYVDVAGGNGAEVAVQMADDPVGNPGTYANWLAKSWSVDRGDFDGAGSGWVDIDITDAVAELVAAHAPATIVVGMLGRSASSDQYAQLAAYDSDTSKAAKLTIEYATAETPRRAAARVAIGRPRSRRKGIEP